MAISEDSKTRGSLTRVLQPVYTRKGTILPGAGDSLRGSDTPGSLQLSDTKSTGSFRLLSGSSSSSLQKTDSPLSETGVSVLSPETIEVGDGEGQREKRLFSPLTRQVPPGPRWLEGHRETKVRPHWKPRPEGPAP